MPLDAGSVVGKLILDDSQYVKAVDDAKKGSDDLSKTLDGTSTATDKLAKSQDTAKVKTESMTASFIKAEVIIEAVKKGFEMLTKFAGDSVKAFVEQEKADALLETRLKSTGNVIGMTATQMKNMAQELSNVSGIDDTIIQQAEALLLTFTNIGGNVFPDATKAILDLSVGLGVDLQTAAMQVGKALNDPAEGLAALRRTGIQFSNAQEEQIKTMVKFGDVAGAQGLIIAELEKKFGGAAEAVRGTFGGSIQALETNMDNLQENLGGVIATLTKGFVEGAADTAGSIAGFIGDIKDWLSSSSESEKISNALKKSTSELVTIYGQYKEVMIKLRENRDDLNKSEKIALEVQKVDLKQKLVAQIQKASEAYNQLNKVAASGKTIIEDDKEKVKNLVSIRDHIGLLITEYGKLSENQKKSFDFSVYKSSIARYEEQVKGLSGQFAHLQEVTQFATYLDFDTISTGYRELTKIISDMESSTVKSQANIDGYVRVIAEGIKDNIISADTLLSESTGFQNKVRDEMAQIDKERAAEAKAEKDKQAEIDKAREKELADRINKERKRLNDENSRLLKEQETEEKKAIKTHEDDVRGAWALQQRIHDQQDDRRKQAAANEAAMVKEMAAAWTYLKEKVVPVLNEISNALNAGSKIVQDVFATISMFGDNEMQNMKNKNGAIMEQMQADYDAKMTAFEENAAAEQESLEAQKEQGIITEEEYNARKMALDKKQGDDKKALEKKLATELAAEKKKQAEEEKALKKKQFEQQKAYNIAMAWINFAIATVSIWASAFATSGSPIAAAVIAGIMTAAMLGITIAQTVAISQQPFPEYARGGTVQGDQWARVNEKGGEIQRLQDGTVVIPNDISQGIMDRVERKTSAGGVPIYLQVNFNGKTVEDHLITVAEGERLIVNV